MYAFLDDFGIITVLIEKGRINELVLFSLGEGRKVIEDLQITHIKEIDGYVVYTLKYNIVLSLHKIYRITANSKLSCNLHSGSIIRTPRFEEEFFYDGELGVKYSPLKSVFRIWSPVANKITLVLDKKKYPLEYTSKGLWMTEVLGDFEGKKYFYMVEINDKKQKILDPYGLSSDTNGECNYVVDSKQFRKFKSPKPSFSGNYVDAIIYEASVRDMSFHASAGARYRGKFLGLLENHPTSSNLPTGVDYLSYLGITHLQLMPIYDFDGVNDTSNKLYNWGYNPHQYFVPCGWYTTNPEDPYARIDELIKLIDTVHKKGIRVVLDVVFNHVFDYKVFPLDTLVPGYFFRVDEKGTLTEVTGCQNDLATERKMTRKLIVDNLMYFAEYFQVDGFRFDLMGLLDVDTMNEIRLRMDQIDKTIMLYGEGWNMPNTLPEQKRPHMNNHYLLQGYAFFNDKYRDYLKGSQWHKTIGYTLGSQNADEVYNLLTGSCVNNYKFANPNQTINYVECHDNYTFFDFAKVNCPNLSNQQIKNAAKLALGIILVSQGIPFIHAGQEFLRTKDLTENSYNKGDIINRFDYFLRDENLDMVYMVKDLIEIRKTYKDLRFTLSYDIINNVYFVEKTKYNTIGIATSNGLCVYIKNSYYKEEITKQGNMAMIFDGWKKTNSMKDNYVVDEPGVYIFKKEI